MDSRDTQLRRAVRHACKWLKTVRSLAVVRFFEQLVVELEKQLRMGNQHEKFQTFKRFNWRKLRRPNRNTSVTWKADCRKTKNVSARGGCDIPLAAEHEIRYFRYQHFKEIAAATLCKCPRNELAEKEVVTAMKVMTNEKTEGPKGLPVELRNSDFNKIGPSYSSSTGVPPMSDAREKFHSVAETPSLPYFTRTATRR